MWNLKYDTDELIYETETDSWTQKTHQHESATSIHASPQLETPSLLPAGIFYF